MKYFAKTALLPSGWAENVLISIDSEGHFSSVVCDQEKDDAVELSGSVIPGIANCHSHAFQRAMAGLAEYSTNPKDSFWTWRNIMYDFALKISPEQLSVIASQLYIEMLKAGYTSVAEFHYLHHDINGESYSNPAEMSDAIISAAQQTGIALTHLPVLYMSSGFGNQAPQDTQRRFIHDVEKFINLLETLKAKQTTQFKLGVALHSLRAVSEQAITEVTNYLSQLDSSAPIHIHIAEQQQEVKDCINWSGQRPVEWLLNHYDLNEQWNLVHATHLTAEETQQLALSKSTVVICPTTEANLGDGLFPLKEYLNAGGNLTIGSDSHISVDPIEELRWLEYGQRLKAQNRNIVATENQPHCGTNLWQSACENSSLSMGKKLGKIESGYQADLLVVDESKPQLAARHQDDLLNSLVFSGRSNCFKDVMVAGKWQVQNYHHEKEGEIASAYFETSKQLLSC